VARDRFTACSDATKGVFAGGGESPAFDIIDYITIQTTGDATDFGNLTSTRQGLGACSGD
jgi:hypothetical protein